MQKQTKEIKPNWLINMGVGICLLVIILASVVNPILIYLALVFVGFISVTNMVRIERLILGKKKESEVEETEESEEDLDKSPKKPYLEAIEKARDYLKNGYTKEEIAEGLKEKYDNAIVNWIIKEAEV